MLELEEVIRRCPGSELTRILTNTVDVSVDTGRLTRPAKLLTRSSLITGEARRTYRFQQGSR